MDTKTWDFWSLSNRLYTSTIFTERDRDSQIAYLKYAIKCLRAQMCSDALSNVVFSDSFAVDGEQNDKPNDSFPILTSYLALGLTVPTRVMALDGGKVYAAPEDAEELADAALDIDRDGFVFDKNNFHGDYYPELDLAIVHDGVNHSVAATMQMPVTLHLQILSLAPLFDKLCCNGHVWTLGGKVIPVVDMRFAAMYEFARKIHELEEAESTRRGEEPGSTPTDSDPRLCYLVGVKPDFPFRVKVRGSDSRRIIFDDEGVPRWADQDTSDDLLEAICWALNHPWDVIKIPVC